MKREAMLALGLVAGCVILGAVWMAERGEVGEKRIEADHRRGREDGRGPEAGPDEWVQYEVGPDGLRPIAVEGEVEGTPALSGGGLPGSAPGSGRESAFSGTEGMPRNASSLLARGDPVIHAVGALLREAGVSEPILEGTRWGVHEHVQRLAAFKMYADHDRETVEAMERHAAELDETGQAAMPSLGWRLDIWPARSREYAGYVRRDLEMRLGIQDGAVVDRLIEIAVMASERNGNAGTAVEAGEGGLETSP